MPIHKESVKQILAVRNDRFGEFLLNIPAWRALKANYPYAKLTLVVNPYVAQLARCVKEADDTIIRENRKHRIVEILQFASKLKARHFDLCVIFNPSGEFNLISFLARIPVRLGYDRKWAFLLTHKVQDSKHLGLRHEIEYNLELLTPLGISSKDYKLSLNIDTSKINSFEGLGWQDNSLGIAIHPWTSDPVKQWPQEKFYELARILALGDRTKVIIIGGKEELDKGASRYDTLGANVLNLTGKTTLVELAGLLKKVKLLISGDSGPVHLASCVKTTALVLFRNDLPGKNSIRWGPVSEESIVIENPDLSQITVDEVLSQVKKILKI